MRACGLVLMFCVLAAAPVAASDDHGAPARPAASHAPSPMSAHPAALPGKPVPPGPAAHGTPAPAPVSAKADPPVVAGAGQRGAAKPAAPSSAAAAAHGGAPVTAGPVDGRGPDRGRAVVRLTSGRGTKTRRVTVTWPEPDRLTLKWDEPADRVMLVWPTGGP